MFSYHQLAFVHLATVLPAFALGTVLLIRRKGTHSHRLIGKIYMLLMLGTGILTLFMPAVVGPQILGHFGFIHLLSILTLVTVPTAYLAARSHQVRRHQYSMIGLYVGGLLIAGSLAFTPGRLLHGLLFSTG